MIYWFEQLAGVLERISAASTLLRLEKLRNIVHKRCGLAELVSMLPVISFQLFYNFDMEFYFYDSVFTDGI